MANEMPILHQRVAVLEEGHQTHAELIARLELRTDRLERSMEAFQDGQDAIVSAVGSVQRDINDFAKGALESWPAEAVQALNTERSTGGKMLHVMFAICSAETSLLVAALFMLARTHGVG